MRMGFMVPLGLLIATSVVAKAPAEMWQAPHGDRAHRMRAPHSPTVVAVGADFAPPTFSASFDQLSFASLDATSATANNSSLGQMTVAFTPASACFLNVAARLPGQVTPQWIVRNTYLPDSLQGAPAETLTTRVDLSPLGVASGQALLNLEWGWTLTPDPVLDADEADWLAAVPWQGVAEVGQVEIATGGAASGPETPLQPTAGNSFYPLFPLPGFGIASWIGCRMPNLDLDQVRNSNDLGGCVPAACANSMAWLKGKHPDMQVPPGPRDIYEQLRNLMNHAVHYGEDIRGVCDSVAVVAKLDFIEAYELPVRVEYQSSYYDGPIKSTSGISTAACMNRGKFELPAADWLLGEAAAGEDVEFGVTRLYIDDYGKVRRLLGHCAVVSGAGMVAGVPAIAFKDDEDSRRRGYTSQSFSLLLWDPDPSAQGFRVTGLEGETTLPSGDKSVVYAYLTSVLSESYDPAVVPPPSQDAFPGYCHSIRRTIPPRHKLTIAFPGETRCYNVTVRVLDRSVQPSQWVKTGVWNFNRDMTRQVVNQSDVPVTIEIHDDDFTRSGGVDVPFSVHLGIEPCGPEEASTPSNEEAFGGFSLGREDTTCSEFGTTLDSSVVVVDSLGSRLTAVPGTLGGTGTAHLVLSHPISHWSTYWEHLALVLGVASVGAPGALLVECATTGLRRMIEIDKAGDYRLDLGHTAVTSEFRLSLRAQNGLQCSLDYIGVPSLVGVEPLVVSDAVLPPALMLEPIAPNPVRSGGAMIRFGLPRGGACELALFGVDGRWLGTLAKGVFGAGFHTVAWDGRDARGRGLASGVYFLRLEVAGTTVARKVAIVH